MAGTNQFVAGSRIQMDHAAAGSTSKSPTARPPHLNTSRTNVSERLQCGFRPGSRPAASSARSSASALPRLAQRGADVGVMRRPTIALVAGREQKMNSFAPTLPLVGSDCIPPLAGRLHGLRCTVDTCAMAYVR